MTFYFIPIKKYFQLKCIVERTLKCGAKLVKGGASPNGLFYKPTLITDVTPDMPTAKEEIFGPVASILKFETEKEVIELANDCARGLAG